MANPNPVRQRNPYAMSDRMKKKFSAYVPRQRLPGEAMPRAINLMAQPAYVPPVWVATRAMTNTAQVRP